MPIVRHDKNPEYSEDPEEILEGEELESYHSFCATCFEGIYAPILKGIWYHNHSRDRRLSTKNEHEPIPADTLTQLFCEYQHHGSGTLLKKTSKYDDDDVLACNCYISWYNLLKKDVEVGFYGEHYFDENGINLCKTRMINISSEPITDPDYPKKQDYNCEECIEILIKKKILKIIPYKGKSTNPIYNSIEWLK